MVLTVAQTIVFFEDDDKMGLDNRTRVDSLDAEGISTVDDMAEWNDDDWDSWVVNCKKPDKITDPANPGQLVAQAPFPISVKSIKRLKAAARLVRYYESIGVVLTAANTGWDTIKNFELQRTAMDEDSKKRAPDVPKLNKNTTVAKWDDSFKVHVRKVYGAREATLEYGIRKEVAVVMPHPGLLADHPHSEAAKSIQGEQANRLSHTHPLYQRDNDQLYSMLEAATRGTAYEATIKPFRMAHNGRGAYLALISQHAGKDTWDSVLRTAKDYINNRKWDGTPAITMEAHIEKCRSCYVDWETAAQHVPDQVPEARSRVKSLLDSMENCQDGKVAARVAYVSDERNGMMTNFENAATYLLPACPVAAKLSKKRKTVTIESVGGNLKSGTGPDTGVELRYYLPKEYKALTKDQQEELRRLRPSKKKSKGKEGVVNGNDRNKRKGHGNGKKWTKKTFNKNVSALIKKHEEAKLEEEKQKAEDVAEIAQLISSISGKSTATDATASAAMQLNSILKKSRSSK